jgi:hypothetical protein
VQGRETASASSHGADSLRPTLMIWDRSRQGRCSPRLPELCTFCALDICFEFRETQFLFCVFAGGVGVRKRIRTIPSSSLFFFFGGCRLKTGNFFFFFFFGGVGLKMAISSSSSSLGV